MRFRVTPTLALVGLLACGGRSLMYSAAGLSTTAPQDAYACATDQFKKLGYRIRARDEADYRILAERENAEIREPTGLFRRGFDRIEVTSAPDASGRTSITLKAQSFKESVTARGNNLDEIEATERARADTQAILEACAQAN